MALYRRPAARVLALVAFVLLGLSAIFFRPAPTPNLLDEALWLMLAGGLTFWVALFLNRNPAPRQHHPSVSQALRDGKGSKGEKFSPTQSSILSPQSFFFLLAGLAAFLVLIESNTGLLGIVALQNASSDSQFLLFVVGLTGLTLAFSGARFLPFSRRHRGEGQGVRGLLFSQSSVLKTQSLFSLSTQYPALITLITLLAFALRAFALGNAVHHFVDEIHFSNAVMSIRPPESMVKLLWPINSITAFPWLFSYMQAWGVDLFGRNLEGLRAISVILGTLGVPALYFLARELFDRRTALLAALFLAVFPPHIQFSRIGLNNIADPLFGTLALAFLVRGFRYNRRVDFALGGAALGLTQYFYEGGRFLFPTLVLLALAWFILVKPRVFTVSETAPASTQDERVRSAQSSVLSPQSFFSLIPFFLTAILIALPVYSTLIATENPLNARFETVGVGGSYWLRVTELGKPQTLEQHLLLPFLVYVHQPEIALYYGGELPMLLPYVVPFVLVGVFGLLAYWRAAGLVIVLWLLLASVGNMILTESAIYARYVVAFPALALLAALGLRMLATLLWPGGSRWRARAVTLAVVVLAVGQVTYFFGPHLARYNDQLRQTFDSEDAVFRSAAFPWGTQVHIITGDNPGHVYLSGIANFLADGLTVFVPPPENVTPGYLGGLSRGVDQAFFLEPFDDVTVEYLNQQFPNLEGPFTSPFNLPTYRQLLLYYARSTASMG